MNFPTLIFAAALLTGTVAAQTPPANYAFDNDAVHVIRLQFKQPDWFQEMTRNYDGVNGSEESVYLDASLEWGPHKFDSVGVRFKGNSSYRGAPRKKPFRIKTNEFVKGQKINGIGAFNLNNGWNDPSMVREKLYFEMAEKLGLRAARQNFAALYINGEYWGLYGLGEVVNSDFLQNYFTKGQDTGNLYKGNIGATFAYLGADKSSYTSVWEKQTNEEADDWTDLIELCRALNETPDAELKAKLESLIDIDSVLTAMALDNATVNLDNYVGMAQNFNIYRRPSDNRWVWIPWDASLAFGAFSQGNLGNVSQLALDYLPQAGGLPGGGLPGGRNNARPLLTKLWSIPEYKERYLQIYRRLTETVYLPESIGTRAQTLQAMIRPWLEADTQKLSTLAAFDASLTQPLTTGGFPGFPGPGGPGGPGGAQPGIRTLLDARAAWLKSQFETIQSPALSFAASTPSLTFSTATAGTNPAAQTVTINATGTRTLASYSLIARTHFGGSWLVPGHAGGVLPGSFTVSVATKDMAVGSYTGEIAVYVPGATAPVSTIPVTLTVGSPATPAVATLANGASYAAAPIAPGQIVTVFGSNMGPATLASGVFHNGALRTAANGVQVLFDGVAAPVLYARNDQVSVIAPYALAGKSTTSVVVTSGALRSSPSSVSVTDAAPGLFTVDASGRGAAAILNQDGSLNTATAAAAKGSTVSIYLTGLGVLNPAGTDGGVGSSSTLQRATGTVTVTIGGQTAAVTYAGAVPGSVLGLNQVNVTVPAAAASGSAVPVVVTVNGKASQAGATLAVQ